MKYPVKNEKFTARNEMLLRNINLQKTFRLIIKIIYFFTGTITGRQVLNRIISDEENKINPKKWEINITNAF